LAVVVVTGTLRAFNETGSWRALTQTAFGRLVMAKGALLAVLAALGGLNRLRHVPRARETVAGLRRVSRVEIALAMLVLGLTGVMASIAPARTAASAKPSAVRAVVVSGTDFGTTLRAHLELSPGRPGPNRFVLRLTDYDTGAEVVARRVSVRFTYRARPDVQPSTLELPRQPDGAYAARGSNVALGGPWKAIVLVEREATAVEVALSFATSGQAIQKIETPGSPTLYDVPLAAGGSVQFYVDPPRAGVAEVHATFFDESGSELGGLEDIVLIASPPDAGEPISLPVRLLSPGHFVADATLVAGRWRFDVAATGRSQDIISAYFEESITR
ncbi:MAG: CopD family protein, partial [Actinomycetota bacterium]